MKVWGKSGMFSIVVFVVINLKHPLVAQDGLKLSVILMPPSTGTADTYHHTLLGKEISKLPPVRVGGSPCLPALVLTKLCLGLSPPPSPQPQTGSL